jgi:OmpA-OmpF porin, OOP family
LSEIVFINWEKNMKSPKLKLSVVAISAAFAVLVTQSAQAAPAEAGFYVGGMVGYSKARLETRNLAQQFLGGGFTVSPSAEDERDVAGKALIGLKFNRFFSLEASYFDLGESAFKTNTVPAGTLSGTTNVRGAGLDLVTTAPITDGLSAFLRVGAQYAESKDAFASTGAATVPYTSRKHRETNIKYGLGLEYALTDSIGLRLEAERYRLNDAVDQHVNVDAVSLGIVYRFGATAPAPYVAPEPMPVYTPPAPTPAPVVVVVPPPAPVAPPPPPMPTKVSFSADSFFAFGKADVTPDGKQQLNKFATDLRGVSYDTIKVTGHSDRIGSQAANQKLSTRRAETVKTILVETEGVPAEKISAVGVGSTDPVTKPEDCRGNKANKALIACLQPDRRVDVEVTGTKPPAQ